MKDWIVTWRSPNSGNGKLSRVEMHCSLNKVTMYTQSLETNNKYDITVKEKK